MKNVRKVLSLFIMMTVIFTTFSFAASSMSEEILSNAESTASSTSIVSVSSKTVGLNTEFYLILNLSNISYTKFKVEITNTSSLSADEITSTVSELSTNSVVTTFTVDKDSIGLDKLGIVYTSPSQEAVVSFNVKITSLDETVDDLNSTLSTLENELTTLQSALTTLQETLAGITDETSEEYVSVSEQIESTNTSIEEKETEIADVSSQIEGFTEETVEESASVTVTEESDEESEFDKKNAWGDEDMEEMSSSMKKMMEDMSSLESELDSANATISSLTATESYQGSQNNYLSSLSITGVEFKNAFNKTSNNYFATVDSSVTSVTVKAVAEDSDAIVTIYGNTNLQSGKNKIIINVTAEDGSVRTYKIYVTK